MKGAGGKHLGGDRPLPAVARSGHGGQGQLHLMGIVNEHGRAVLLADVEALMTDLGSSPNSSCAARVCADGVVRMPALRAR